MASAPQSPFKLANTARVLSPISITYLLVSFGRSKLIKKFMQILVVVNAVVITLELDHEVSSRGIKYPYVDAFHVFITVCFAFEFVLRISYHVADKGLCYLNPIVYLSKSRHTVEIIVLGCSLAMIFWPSFEWRQRPFIVQVIPTLRIVRLYKMNIELELFYVSIWKVVKRVRHILMMCTGIVCVFGLAGFYMFNEKVPELFGTVESSVFSAFALSTKEDWRSTEQAITDGAGQYASRIYCVLDIVIIGTLFYNVLMATVLENVSNRRQKIEDRKIMECVRLKGYKADMMCIDAHWMKAVQTSTRELGKRWEHDINICNRVLDRWAKK